MIVELVWVLSKHESVYLIQVAYFKNKNGVLDGFKYVYIYEMEEM